MKTAFFFHINQFLGFGFFGFDLFGAVSEPKPLRGLLDEVKFEESDEGFCTRQQIKFTQRGQIIIQS